MQHRIELTSPELVNVKPYRYSPAKKQVIQEEVLQMLRDDVIEPSLSPWSSPVVLIKKKDDGWRFCVDYRKLNSITKRDTYPLPRIDDLLDSLKEKKYFSLLDLRSGFWQLPMAPEDREKTAFTTAGGTYQFKRMPFGLTNAPATFQRLIDQTLGGLKWTSCFAFIDDSLIATQTFSEHLTALREVFNRLRQAGLTLKKEKCFIGKTELEFLGHRITKAGLHTSPGKIDKIQIFPVPKNLTEVRCFLGLINWYRNFIPDVSTLSEPLVHLTRKKSDWAWTPSQQEAFEILKNRLICAPVLVRPDYQQPFTVQVDASDLGLGVVLSHPHTNGHFQAIAYASCWLNSAEQKYATIEKECLTIIWAIEHFRL